MSEQLTPRCSVCLVRHTEEESDCVPEGEEGRIDREILADAFRSGLGVCLPCQAVLHLDPGDREKGCPGCGRPLERFEEDDLEWVGDAAR